MVLDAYHETRTSIYAFETAHNANGLFWNF